MGDFRVAPTRFWQIVMWQVMQCFTNTMYSDGGLLLTTIRDAIAWLKE